MDDVLVICEQEIEGIPFNMGGFIYALGQEVFFGELLKSLVHELFFTGRVTVLRMRPFDTW